MHYPRIFAKITNIDPACVNMGQRLNLSAGDIDTVNFMYGKFPLMAPIAALSRTADFMDIFSVADTGGMLSAWWNGNPWRPWFRLFNKTFAALSPVSAVSRNSNQMDIFTIEGGQLWSCWFTGNWNDWFALPLPVSGDPDSNEFPALCNVVALSRDPNYMDVFAIDKHGAVRGVWWNGNPWRPWFTLGSKLFPPGAPIAGVCRNSNQMDLFIAGADSQLWSIYFTGNWIDNWFQPLLSSQVLRPNTQIAAISRNPDQMDLFAISPYNTISRPDGQLWSCWWNGSWNDWFPLYLPASPTSPQSESFPQFGHVTAVSRDPNYMDVFSVDNNGDVRSVWWNGSWMPWFTLGGKKFPPGAPIAVNSRNSNQMDLFIVSEDQGIWSNWFDGSWHDWFRVS